MSERKITYEGQLCRPWGAGRPTPAQAYVPAFYDPLDFDSYRLMGRDDAVQAHVTYPDHYALLEAILTLVTEETGGAVQETLINSRMPSVVRVPQSFFGRNVMFMNAPLAEAEVLAGQGVCVMVIEEQFLRHTVEQADNSLVLHWFNAPAGAAAAMERIAAGLETLGIAPGIGAAA